MLLNYIGVSPKGSDIDLDSTFYSLCRILFGLKSFGHFRTSLFMIIRGSSEACGLLTTSECIFEKLQVMCASKDVWMLYFEF